MIHQPPHDVRAHGPSRHFVAPLGIVCSVVLGSAVLVQPRASAHADECRIDENCEVRVESLDYSGTWQWQLEAGLTLDGRIDSDAQRENEATAKVAGELSYDGKTCRWFGAAAALGGFWDGSEADLTGRQELTACLPYPVFRPEFRVGLNQNLRPRLAAAPKVRASRVRGGDIYMLVNTIHLSATKDEVTTHMNFLVVGGGVELVSQDVIDMPTRASSTNFVFDMIRGIEYGEGFLGNDRELRIIAIEGEALGNAEEENPDGILDVLAADLLFFSTRSARLWRTGLHADMALGMSVGDLPDVQVLSPHIELTVMGGDAFRSFGVGYTRRLEGTNYSAVLMEDRLAGWWRQAGDRNATIVRGFAALTEIVDNQGERERTLTGGVGLHRDMMLGNYLHIAFSAELARSYYATLHGDVPLEPAWVAQVSVSASAFVGSD